LYQVLYGLGGEMRITCCLVCISRGALALSFPTPHHNVLFDHVYFRAQTVVDW
jgi:hypothetical protein